MLQLLLTLLALGWTSTYSHAEVSGLLKSSTDIYTTTLGEPTDDLTPYLNLELKAKSKLSRNFRFQGRGVLIANPESETSPEKFFADLPEGYVEGKFGKARARAGMNTINWGVVDIFSPSDVVNPSVMFHPLRTQRRGSPMIEAEWKSSWFGAHAIYIPRQMRSVMPSMDSRWLPRQVILNTTYNGYRIELPEVLEYSLLPSRELDHALDHNGGLRLSAHVGSFDFYLMHFEGSAPTPKIFTEIELNATQVLSPIRLQLVSYRVRTSSAAAVWAGENLIVRAESAYQYSETKSAGIQPWSWSNVLALESNADIGSRTITLLAQYYHTENPQDPDNLISSSYRLFDRTLLLGARFEPMEDWLVTGSALWDSATDGWFWMAGFEQKLSDTLRWGLSWRDFSAAQDGLLKTFERNDHATLDLTYYF